VGWQRYEVYDAYINVDTSHCGFVQTPIYTASIAGNGDQWIVNGESAIYSETSTGFRIYIQDTDVNSTVDMLNLAGVRNW